MTSRRHFLKMGACAGVLPMLGVPKIAFANSPLPLVAQTVKSDFFGNGTMTRTWGYNNMTPGPTLRAKRGERIRVRFENTLPQPSSVHWHGIRVENAMDGVPAMTQPYVQRGQSFDYDFIVPDAGTYWYHAHNKSWEQVARGLYGPLIVIEDSPPATDRDIMVIVDDWLLNRQGQIVDDFEDWHAMSHDGRLGNMAKVFFRDTMTDQYPTALKRNQRVRFRFINPATDRTFALQIRGAKYRVVAYDGMPIRTPVSSRKLTLASAQRIDIIADITGDEFGIDFIVKNKKIRLGTLPVQGEVAQNTLPITALERHNLPEPNIRTATKLDFVLGGGAMSTQMMRGMMGGMMGGQSTENIWTINDTSGMGNTPYYRFKRGETAILNMVNDTRFDHVIHLHGHHAKLLHTLDTFQDSIFIKRKQKTAVAVVFDNPGKWMIHCHMLGHQVSGMKTWVEVA